MSNRLKNTLVAGSLLGLASTMTACGSPAESPWASQANTAAKEDHFDAAEGFTPKKIEDWNGTVVIGKLSIGDCDFKDVSATATYDQKYGYQPSDDMASSIPVIGNFLGEESKPGNLTDLSDYQATFDETQITKNGFLESETTTKGGVTIHFDSASELQEILGGKYNCFSELEVQEPAGP